MVLICLVAVRETVAVAVTVVVAVVLVVGVVDAPGLGVGELLVLPPALSLPDGLGEGEGEADGEGDGEADEEATTVSASDARVADAGSVHV